MVEVTVESIRVSLINQQRIVVLRETAGARYLPIWIGPFEAEAISMGLQGTDAGRPLTHDLLRNVIVELGAMPERVVVSELQDETFLARIVVRLGDRTLELDARPSDAIAVAVRFPVPIFVGDEVMERAGQLPSEEIAEADGAPGQAEGGDAGDLGLFRDFVEGLDLTGLSED